MKYKWSNLNEQNRVFSISWQKIVWKPFIMALVVMISSNEWISLWQDWIAIIQCTCISLDNINSSRVQVILVRKSKLYWSTLSLITIAQVSGYVLVSCGIRASIKYAWFYWFIYFFWAVWSLSNKLHLQNAVVLLHW